VDNVTLGRSGLKVSPISFGTWELGTALDDQRATATIERARELGVNFFDTAPGLDFGESEQILGVALDDEIREDRDDLVFATEGGLRREGDALVRDSSAPALREGVDESLRALHVDAIDLYQVLWPDSRTPFDAIAETLGELMDAGKILHAGLSVFASDPLEPVSRRGPLETLQSSYRLFRRNPHGLWLPFVHAHDLGVLIGGPLADGAFAPDIGQFAGFGPADWQRRTLAFAGDSSGPPAANGSALRRPARGGTTRPLTARPGYGFGRPHRPNPDSTLHRRLAIVDGLEQFAADHGISLSELAVAWTLANPVVDVAVVGASSPDHLEAALGGVDVQLSPGDLARIDRILGSPRRGK
jgi:aryl-alcohol dehydrogenase-like predicted oxidoreductase